MRLVRTNALAKYLDVSQSSLEKDRVLGTLNIPYLKLGRVVLYDLDEVDKYLIERRRESTSDQGAGR